MQGRDVDRHFRRAGVAAKDRGGMLQPLGLPLRDLVDVDVVLLSQFGQRLLALEACTFDIFSFCATPPADFSSVPLTRSPIKFANFLGAQIFSYPKQK